MKWGGEHEPDPLRIEEAAIRSVARILGRPLGDALRVISGLPVSTLSVIFGVDTRGSKKKPIDSDPLPPAA